VNEASASPPIRETELVLILGIAAFASAMAIRIVDPMVPEISRVFGTPVTTTALLASAFALPYAFGQPILGPLGDTFGKARVIKLCVIVATLALALGAFAPSFTFLFATRVVAGFAGGGLIPLGMATLGDRVSMERRQIAISRFMVVTLIGQIVGTSAAGFLLALIGWRGVFAFTAMIAAIATVALLIRLKPLPGATREPFDLGRVFRRYGEILANPRAKVCFSTVFAEGMVVYGLLPHVAHLLELQGKGGAREAGIMIAGMAGGGIIYALIVPMLLRWLGVFRIMAYGGVVAAVALAIAGFDLGLPSGFIAFALLGLGFYMLHNSLQTQASELSQVARGSSMALHAFSFFAGVAIGPVLYGHGLESVGQHLPIFLGSGAIALVGIAAALALRAIVARQAAGTA